MFCVLSMSFIRVFWTGSFASVTARRFLIILTLCNCVACIIVCDCFALPSWCTGIRISISMNSMMNFGLAYRFQVSVFCCLGSWVRDTPPPALQDSQDTPPPALQDSQDTPPLLCRTVLLIPIFSPTLLAGGPSRCESGTVNLKPYFPLSFLLHACILSSRCCALIQTTSSLSLTEPSPVAAGVLNPGVRSLPGDAHFSEWIQA